VDEVNQSTPMLEAPLGMYTARVDEKGRVKLPVDFQQYFAELGEKRFFITSLDGCVASIYTIPRWRQNLRILADFKEDPRAAEDIWFMADDLGGQAEIDNQGRLLFPAELRQELGMENQAVRLRAVDDRVDVLSDKIYAERRVRSRTKESMSANLTKLRQAGLK
jgi:MraZ protein